MHLTLRDIDRLRETDVLVAAKVNRISRSTLDFATLLDHARRSRWALNVLDIGADLTTPAGEIFAPIVAVIAQYERRLIGQRTRDALAIRRAAGVQLGTVHRIPDPIVTRILTAHTAGDGLTTIARALTADGVPTARGGTPWQASTVQAVIRRADTTAAVRDPIRAQMHTAKPDVGAHQDRHATHHLPP
ncbi:recombinase family protein [Frankia sp. R82]|uniref:recombinase family protein n=1 Tax=Frankia sp. R82 TaxID=2950553 RepID=UPI002044A6D5|nr:recombinase family protein [Frankia sp. R82]MCM3885701.1 recombinase family protein [Frankia sp. R82]